MTTRKITTLDGLAEAALIEADDIAALKPVANRYAIALTPQMAALAARDPEGPVARQFVPDAREADDHPAEMADPIGDGLKSPVPGIVHRYPDRVLLKLATACPVYCRFCFRRAEVGPGQPPMLSSERLAAALAYISGTPAIWEVVVTGGDPLVLSPRHLARVTRALAEIPHVRIVRWHTRVPIVAPDLIDEARIAALTPTGKATVLVLHVNHLDEFTPEADAALAALRAAGVMLRSQTVLLKGINDDASILEALMRGLVERGVAPYYLHHPDLAPGTAHVRLPLADGRRIAADLRRRLSGIAQPTYVLDLPGAHGKVPIGPANVEELPDGSYRITDPAGTEHAYRDALSG